MKGNPVYAIGYARVSSPKQAQNGESLDDQVKAISRFVESQGWELFPEMVLEEQWTGSDESRPFYDYALKQIKKHPGKVKYFVVKVIDRLSRGGSESYQAMKRELADLGVELRDVGGVIQPKVNTLQHHGFEYSWSMRSPSEISETVLAEVARNEKTAILTRMISAEISLVQQGYQVGSPNDGYVNKTIFVGGKKRCIQAPDPERAKFFVEMFKLRSEGVYSDPEIVERINAMGYLSKGFRKWSENNKEVVGASEPKRLTVKKLQKIIERVAYCGVVCEKWTNNQPIKAAWDGLVSIDLFNRANRGKVFVRKLEDGNIEILYNQHHSKKIHRRNNFRQDFRFKNVIVCPKCDTPLCASYSRGKSGKRFGSYHCARKHTRHAVPQKILEDTYDQYLQSVRFKDYFLETLEKVLILKFRKEEGDMSRHTADANQQIVNLQQEKAKIAAAFADARTPEMRQVLEEKMASIHEKISDARLIRDKLEVKEDEIHAFIDHAKKLMEHPAKMLENIGNKQEQVSIYGLFFEKFPTYDELTSRTPKLTLAFKVNEESVNAESAFVTLRGIEPRFQE